MNNYLLYIVAFAVAFGVSLLVTPFTKKFAKSVGAIDYPKSRGMHSEPIPRIGGLAIVSGFMASMILLSFFKPEFQSKEFFGFIIGAAIIAILGILDDIYNLNAKFKFVVQITAALIAIYSGAGTRINAYSLPFGDYLEAFEVPITLIWIVGVTNAVNLIDGLDGLAAGVSSIGALCLMILCIITGSETAVIFTAALAGSCFGFLPRNFNPAEVIMGDTGSTFLGYVLAVSSILGVFKNYAVVSVFIAILALALPILDTAFAMLRRFFTGKPIMQADRGHLHHRLIDAGLNSKQAVIVMYLISTIMAVTAILIAIKDFRALVVMIGALIVLSLMVLAYRKRL